MTDPVRSDEELRLREAELQFLLENSADILLRGDNEGRMHWVSPNCRQLGYQPDDFLGDNLQKNVHPEDLPRVAMEAMARSQGAPIPTSLFRFRSRERGWRWIEIKPTHVRDAQGESVEVVVVARDATERRAAEEALQQSEERFRRLAENATDLILEYRPDGVVDYVSPSVETITGRRPSDVMGGPVRAWTHPDDWILVSAAIQAQVESRGAAAPRKIEYRLIGADGREIWMESAPKAKLDAAGQVVGVTDLARDISVRKRLEIELHAARDAAEAAARVKADFLSNMSHELRTPLTAIIGYASLLKPRTDLPAEVITGLDRIARAGDALMAIVNDTLDFSKLEAGLMPIHPRPVRLMECLTDALALFEPQAAAKAVTLTIEPADAPEVIETDPDRLRQILMNLIGNAVKFTAKGSVVLSVRYDADAALLRVEVHDTGPGVDADQQAKLFQRFSQVDASLTRKHGGTGLGLAICRGLVEAMGGEVGVTSTPGEGSCFWFTISAPACLESPDADAPALANLDLTGVRLLVADDNAVNRDMVRTMLEPLGLVITEATDGEEAVQRGAREPVDLILMDLRMPRCDGHEAALRLRNTEGPNRHAPILAFSADIDVDRWGEHLGRDFDGFVKKPLDQTGLILAIAEAVAPQPDAAVSGAR